MTIFRSDLDQWNDVNENPQCESAAGFLFAGESAWRAAIGHLQPLATALKWTLERPFHFGERHSKSRRSSSRDRL